MALDFTGLVTVLGKYVKQINTMDGYFSALESAKDEIYTQLNAESLQDLYRDVPGLYEGFKGNIEGWIQNLISEATKVLTDEEYVLDELPISESDISSVLFGLFDYMTENGDSFDASTVSLGGSDTDVASIGFGPSGIPINRWEAEVIVSRLLDGINAPVANGPASMKYINLESQLAQDCTLYGKIISTGPGIEVAQLYADSPEQAFYTQDTASPGRNGPSLVNGESINLLPQNYDFSSWSGDNPQPGWTVTGGSAGTDWEDSSGTGVGPLRINTAGTYAKQQITGLQRGQSYCFVAYARYQGTAAATATAKMRVENVDGATVHKAFTDVVCSDVNDSNVNFITLTGFWTPTQTVNLDDIYLTIEHDAESDAANYLLIYKALVIPVQYFNGLGHVFVNPYTSLSSLMSVAAGVTIDELPIDEYSSLAITNDNAGVFQTFFRKAFGVQLPTNDAGAETVADTLATA